MSKAPPVKLYVGPDYKEPKLYTHMELMSAFWGVAAKEAMPYVRTASLQYQYSKNDFTLVDRINDADYVVMPYQYDRLLAANPAKVTMIIEEAKKARKPLLIDGAGDIEYPITIPNTVILRVGPYRYSVQPNDIVMPFTAEDLLESFYKGELQMREKPQTPSVGFTGWAEIPFKTRIKIYLKEWSITLGTLFDSRRGAEHKGLLYRARALKILSNDKRIEPHFKARATYSGHIATISGSVENNRKDFVETLGNSDYALCIKGDANASIRFYEALSLGRIPLFLDTACVLPLEDRINYRDFCVFVDWKDVDKIATVLADFHAKCTPEQFTDRQRKAREAYRNYLRMDVFSKHLASILRERLQ